MTALHFEKKKLIEEFCLALLISGLDTVFMEKIEDIEEMMRNLAGHYQQALDLFETQQSAGTLVMKKKASGIYFYESENGHEKYVGKNEIQRLSALAQTKYNYLLGKELSKRINALKSCIEILKNFDHKSLDNLDDCFPNFLRNNIQTIRDENDIYAQNWKNQVRVTREVPQRYQYKTLKGERVRSKSEVIIADRLFTKGIPYFYEKGIRLSEYGRYQFPDFTVLNKRTRKEFIWEHLGMIDDKDYATEQIVKLESFTKAGFYEGKNLIITFETSQRQLSTSIIDSSLKSFFSEDFSDLLKVFRKGFASCNVILLE